VVTLGTKDHYLGRYGSAASKAEYNRLLAEYLGGGGQLPDEHGVTITELIAAFVKDAKGRVSPSEQDCIKQSLRILRQLYGRTDVADFSPRALLAVREKMIDAGWCRSTVNNRIRRIRRVFKWGVALETVPVTVHQALACVEGLRRGQTRAKESKKVRPVPETALAAIREHVPPMIWDMIQVQLHTGCRPGELVIMRGRDLNMGGTIWEYVPQRHKTEIHNIERIVLIGPRCQEILKPYLQADLEAYLFSPTESEQRRNSARSEARRTPRWPSHMKRNERIRAASKRRKHPPRDRYDVASYRKPIYRACDKAGIDRWAPGRLRHNAATRLRREFGIELARTILGHSDLSTTMIYAEADLQRARDAMAKVG
jgi:integrase